MTDSIKPSKSPYIVGLAGGSGSGKTFFAEALQRRLGRPCCSIILQDSFYFDQSSRFDFDGGSVNFDHPDSIDFDLLATEVGRLKRGLACAVPVYDFKTHSRKSSGVPTQPTPIVLVDGILIFHQENVRSLFDDLIFFDTPEDIRFQRRLERDVKERGRTAEGVRNQFTKQVKPMHDRFVEPSKKHARQIVCDLLDFDRVLEAVTMGLSGLCASKG